MIPDNGVDISLNNGSGEISITTSYIGKAKIYYEIIDSKGNKLIKVVCCHQIRQRYLIIWNL